MSLNFKIKITDAKTGLYPYELTRLSNGGSTQLREPEGLYPYESTRLSNDG